MLRSASVQLRDCVIPAWNAGIQADMDVSGRILRIWIPAIHAGMTGSLLLCFVNERKLMQHSVVKSFSLPVVPYFLGRPDILIQVEQIVRVIFRFERSQALVVRPVGCRDGILPIVVT